MAGNYFQAVKQKDGAIKCCRFGWRSQGGCRYCSFNGR